MQFRGPQLIDIHFVPLLLLVVIDKRKAFGSQEIIIKSKTAAFPAREQVEYSAAAFNTVALSSIFTQWLIHQRRKLITVLIIARRLACLI